MLERNSTGYTSEIMSTNEESSSAHSSIRKQHKQQSLSLFTTIESQESLFVCSKIQKKKQNIIHKLHSEEKKPKSDNRPDLRFDKLEIVANLNSQNQTESNCDTKQLKPELKSSDNSSKIDLRS